MEKPYVTTIIPKGTLLFRGVSSIADLTGDFAGILSVNSTYCLYPNFNVFFYPYPFVADIVKEYRYICIFVLLRDVKLINLISPSPYTRSGRYEKKGGIISCDKIESTCIEQGRPYDACIDFKVVEDNDVVGMLAIPQADSKSLKRLINNHSNTGKYYNKYYKLYKDAHETIGIPEIILYPRKEIRKEDKEEIRDFSTWIDKNKDDVNYLHFHIMEYDKDELEFIMDDLLSKKGFKNNHAAINKVTGFFQIIELSDEFKKTEDLSKESKSFIYKTAKKEDYDTSEKIQIYNIIQKWVSENDVEKELELNNLDFETMPELPENVKYLSIINNRYINTIDNLPPNLISLDCYSNKELKNIIMPNTLTELNCSATSIDKLNIPNNLKILYCNNCKNLEHFSKFPNTLVLLEATRNNFTRLPRLPNTLESLEIDSCSNIDKLPNIPTNLKVLSIKDTAIKLRDIIDDLPEGIKLYIDNNSNNNSEVNPYNI